MGLYYRAVTDVGHIILAPSCASAFCADPSGKISMVPVNTKENPTKVKSVSVLSEDELESYSIAEILDPKWVQPRKRKSV